MKILHYLSGLPPVRGGGMIKYALDLAEAQSSTDEVYLLVPGRISLCSSKRSKVTIKRSGSWNRIPVFRIRNPLPIPMANGILDIAWYTLSCGTKAYRVFLEKLQPELIHVHTFMGLHAEFLQAAKELHIPVVYTTHDYFGLCPRTNLMYQDEVCTQIGTNCGECSRCAFSPKRLWLEQTKIYSLYRKNFYFVKVLQSAFLKNRFDSLRSHQPTTQVDAGNAPENERLPLASDYAGLLEYYREMFSQVTFFHFNSNQTREVYEKFLGPVQGMVIHLGNKSICDRRSQKQMDRMLRIGYLGGDAVFKGLKRLQQAMRELYDEGLTEMELHIYGSADNSHGDFCRYHEAYTPNEMVQVFSQMDILAVPSHWMETFGMVTLEAISFGVPVLITNKVGAKDIVNGAEQPLGCVVQDTVPALKNAISSYYWDRNKLKQLNKNIIQADINFDYKDHIQKLHRLYRRCIAK